MRDLKKQSGLKFKPNRRVTFAPYSSATGKVSTRGKPTSLLRFKAPLRKIAAYSKHILIMGVLVFLVYLFWFVLVHEDFFSVATVRVSGAHNFVNPQDVTKVASELVVTKNIFSVSEVAVKKALAAQFLGAKSIEVTKKLPDELNVLITERVPLAIFTTPKRENYYMVDDAGYVLGKAQPKSQDLPEIIYDGDIQVGYFLDKELVPVYMTLIAALKSYGLNPQNVVLYPRYVAFSLNAVDQILISKDTDIKQTAKNLNALLLQIGYSNTTIKRIDLRFDKLIVEY